MKMLFTVILILILSLYCRVLIAQNANNIVFKGKVVNADSFEPLPAVHIVKNGLKGTVSNAKGEFSIVVAPGDTISWSFVGYKEQVLRINDSGKKITFKLIRLQPATRILEKVEVRPWPSSTQLLKESILEQQVISSRETINAQENINTLQYQALYGSSFNGFDMNAEDNHQNYMQGPSAGNILGFVGLILGVVKGEAIPGSYQHYKSYIKDKN